MLDAYLSVWDELAEQRTPEQGRDRGPSEPAAAGAPGQSRRKDPRKRETKKAVAAL